MEPTFLPTTIPFTPNAKPAILSSNVFDGYWARKDPWLDGSTVLDQRTGLGTPRPPEPRRCLELNGTDQYGWIDVDTVNYPFTIFGFSISDLTNTRWLVSLSDPSNSTRYFTFGYNNGDLITIGRRNTTETLNSQAVDLVNGWASYVVCFVDATTVEVYRNGMLLHTFSGITSVPAGAGLTRFAVGTFRTVSPAGNWDGRAMHCGFLRRAATLADAQAFHQTGIIPDAEVLLPLDGNSTTVAHNIGTSAAHWLDEPRRNLLQYTESLNNATFWVLRRITEDNTFTNPFGNQAITIRDTTENGTHGPYHVPVVASVSGQELAFSVVAQAGTSSVLGLAIMKSNESPSGIPEASFNTTTGEVLSGPGTIEPLGDGWYKCAVSGTVNATDNYRGFLYMYNSEGLRTYVGTELNTITISEPQLELGSTATEYQPVLGTGIDYPEATIVNGAAGMLYEGRDVPFSRQNEVGFSERNNLLDNSNGFAASPWVVISGGTGVNPVRTANAAVAPDGTMTATRVDFDRGVGNTGSDFSRIVQTFSTSVSGQHTQSLWMKAATSADIGKQVALRNVGGTNYGAVELTSDWVRYVRTEVGVFPNFEIASRGVFSADNQVSALLWEGQLEAGDSATELQRIISNPGTSVRIPALLSDPTKSAATDPLTYTGKAHFDGTLEQSNCLTFDGVDDYISMDLVDVAGPELVTNGDFSDGTTGWIDDFESTISGGQLTLNAVAAARRRQDNVTINGRTYYFEIDVISTSNSWRIDNAASVAISYGNFGVVSGIVKGTFVANSATNSVRFINLNTSGTVVVNSISVRELPAGALGQELVTNQTFDSDTTGWYVGANSSASVVNGEAQVTFGGPMTSTAGNWFSFGSAVSTGDTRKFRIEFDATWISGTGSLQVGTGYVVNRTIEPNAGKTSYVVGASGLNGGFGANVTPGAIVFGSTSAGTVWAIDNVSVKQVGLIPHDGTSLLTYRPEGDGINGTAGTAYNIRLGDVEHIPCSEGAGDVVHGTKLNQAYPIVNGQASNWTANKQNDYHYNITNGCSRIELSSPTDIASLLWWYDPSDLSTLFQDSVGTTPVTSDGDPVGLVLDKSEGLVAGSELIPDVGFDDPTDWTFVGSASVSGGQGLFNAAATGARIDSKATLQLGRWYEIEVDVASITSGTVRVATALGTSPFLVLSVGVNKCYLPATGSAATATLVAIGTTTAAINSFSVKELPGYHRFQPTSGSRLTYRTSGGLHWLEYDGVDDGMYTAATVDHSVSNEVTICVGASRVSGNNNATVLENSSNALTNDGTFRISANGGSMENWEFGLRGTTSAGNFRYTTAGSTTNVVSLIGKLVSGASALSEQLQARRDAVDATVTGAPTTGGVNFGNHVLYFGRRNNATNPWQGKEYQSCGFTTVLNPLELAVIEQFIAGKTGVTL